MTLFVEDTFTGSGNLTTHVGETGASWSFINYNSNTDTLAKLTLSGGAVSRADITPSDYFTDTLASGTPPGSDYFVEADFHYAGPEDETGTTALILYFRSLPAGEGDHGSQEYLKVELYPGWGANSVYVGYEDYWAWPGGYGSTTLSEPALVGDHTLRVEAEGTTMRVYVDSVLKLTGTVGAVRAGRVGFGMAIGTDPSELQVLAFRAGTLGPPPPPPGFDFWTATTGVTQT